ncbi:50S ribosomal protein L21 [Buchnera aphidicola]|uniref:Large ribosomal subunit protein bL21m n=2 Tax=cellular organisms TaxID=131567 RepID=A0A8T1XKI3_ARASU|nr:50S ribosomal protein L21 [Buchnera aphidicola]KAG7531922.1 L21-like superfamily [Arabidopsis suecica]AHG60002.1 Rplu [Buchnera aphidicola str. USDA (Myzus persicae)]AHG60582.1 Rplu [Buchnera aphidicola str. W106 (Myzus persicae)]AHG61155.1 Rplu [Buchnera aphidicola str. G002 (Myzus persicae)]AHG61727.1 Rplu [Buchnera aphidicola str. F009 (Myzus persicae)]
MYAVFISGGKQYRVIKNQIIRLEKLKNPIGTTIEFKKILIMSNNKDVQRIGTPFITGGIIKANIENHGRLKKIKVIKFNRRKHYKKQQGHRQYFTDVKILDINNISEEIEKNGS